MSDSSLGCPEDHNGRSSSFWFEKSFRKQFPKQQNMLHDVANICLNDTEETSAIINNYLIILKFSHKLFRVGRWSSPRPNWLHFQHSSSVKQQKVDRVCQLTHKPSSRTGSRNDLHISQELLLFSRVKEVNRHQEKLEISKHKCSGQHVKNGGSKSWHLAVRHWLVDVFCMILWRVLQIDESGQTNKNARQGTFVACWCNHPLCGSKVKQNRLFSFHSIFRKPTCWHTKP